MLHVTTYKDIHKDQIINLILDIQRNEYSLPITIEDQPDLNNIPLVYQNKLGNFWVSLKENMVVGTIGLIDIGNNQGVIRKMFVKKDHRGHLHKVAQFLLDELLSWCKKESIKELYLGTTEKYIAAHKFYEKNRFQEISKYDLPSTFPLMPIDNKFYTLKLSIYSS